jgi:hypothetical protein
MKTCFRIYTEDVNRENVKLACKVLDSYTVIATDGHWNGLAENSLIIEVIDSPALLPVICYIARTIKYLNKQTAVLLTHHSIESELV